MSALIDFLGPQYRRIALITISVTPAMMSSTPSTQMIHTGIKHIRSRVNPAMSRIQAIACLHIKTPPHSPLAAVYAPGDTEVSFYSSFFCGIVQYERPTFVDGYARLALGQHVAHPQRIPKFKIMMVQRIEHSFLRHT